MRLLVAGVLLLAACSSNGGATPDKGQPDGGPDQARGDLPAATRDAARDAKPKGDRALDAGPASPFAAMPASFVGALAAVWGTSASDVFAVGKAGLILHYDGAKWSQMTNSETGDLHAIWGAGPNQVYAVGDGAILYYDGKQWEMDPDYYSYTAEAFRGVWGSSATDVFVVGVSGGSGSVQHKIDGYWEEEAPDSQQELTGIWGTGSDIFVVGRGGTVLKRGSASFTAMPSGVTSDLQTIWGTSATDVFAAGLDGTVLRYDGSTWSAMAIPTSSYFYGLWGSSNKDVYVVGQGLFNPDETAFRYDGAAWTKLVGPKASLVGIWGSSATDIFVVSASTIFHYGGKP
jgi:hypothetical protein